MESASSDPPRQDGDAVRPLPRPSGPSPVGRTSMEWVDAARPERYSTDPSDRRELIVWIWYPAQTGGPADPAPYLPPAWAPAGELLGVQVDGLISNACVDAPPEDRPGGYPVLLLSPSGFPPLLLAATAEELASRGYIVVGVNHTYEAAVSVFADGRVVPMNPEAVAGALGPQAGPHEEAFARRAAVCEYKAADLIFVADQLERINAQKGGLLQGRLDLLRLGGLGHSFGGDAVLEWCRCDRRCTAAANLDGALWTEVGSTGLERPVLQVLAPHREFAVTPQEAVTAGMAPDPSWFEAEKAITFGGWRTVDRTACPGYTLRVEGATHLSFMDVPFLPLRPGAAAASMLSATTIEPARMWRILNDLLLGFFGRHLDGATAPLLEDPVLRYPELTAGTP